VSGKTAASDETPAAHPRSTASARRPRIAIITRSIDRSGSSGSGHHLREMIRHLIPLAPDLDITLAHYDPSSDEVYTLAPELILPTNPLRAAAALNRGGFDVVHFSPLTIVSPINGLRTRKAATVHSAEPMLLPEAYSWIKRVHSAHLIPRYARRLDALVTVSETSKRWFAEHYRVPPERIHVTYNACSPAYRRLSAEELSGAPGEAPFILHVSRFSERKNPWTMLEAFADLVAGIEVERPATTPGGNGSSGPGQAPSIPADLRLVLAGKGWDGDTVWNRARELGVADRLDTPGFVAEETVVRLLNRAAVFWFPSLSEGFGMPNIEAMTCGCPVITSAVFAIPEVVGDAAVVLADPRDARGLADATRQIITDPARREALIAAGLAWSRRYSWDASARVLADVFRDLAGR
jgi:glycosyltransferase involved in cell wall biosynthesis